LHFRDRFTNCEIGASFLADFKANVSPWSQQVEVCEGDIADHGWTGQRIEVLFIDLAKTWRINDLMLEQFFPCLIPGHSIIIQQDYMWGFGPWLHITMELLAPYVTFLDSMLCSTVYLLRKRIPRKFIGINLRTDIPDNLKLDLIDRAVNRWTGEQRGLVELARVMLYREIYSRSRTEDALADVLRRYPDDKVVQTCGKRVAGDIAGEPWWIE
jgi:hypothetical protein